MTLLGTIAKAAAARAILSALTDAPRAKAPHSTIPGGVGLASLLDEADALFSQLLAARQSLWESCLAALDVAACLEGPVVHLDRYINERFPRLRAQAERDADEALARRLIDATRALRDFARGDADSNRSEVADEVSRIVDDVSASLPGVLGGAGLLALAAGVVLLWPRR